MTSNTFNSLGPMYKDSYWEEERRRREALLAQSRPAPVNQTGGHATATLVPQNQEPKQDRFSFRRIFKTLRS